MANKIVVVITDTSGTVLKEFNVTVAIGEFFRDKRSHDKTQMALADDVMEVLELNRRFSVQDDN